MIQWAMQRACKLARLRVRNPHDLRHTYAKMLLMDHYSPAYVQKQLGHSSISITVDIYGHWIPGEGKKDLGKTLRGREALPSRTPTLVTEADSPQWPQQMITSGATYDAVLLGPKLRRNRDLWLKQKA